MRKEMLFQNKRVTYRIIGAVVGVYLLYGLIMGGISFTAQKNAQKAAEILDKVTYTEKSAPDEMQVLETFVDAHLLTDRARGNVYKALAELSYMTGDDMLYNKYVATALFYLEKEEDADSVVYLTNKYMGRLYANGCYEAAEELLKGLAEKYNIGDFSLEMQASYYLSRADLAQMLDDDTNEYLQQAQAAILLMEDSKEKQLNYAKMELLTARHEMMYGSWERAEKIVYSYKETDSFGYDEDQVYVVCDFKIPYEELMTKVKLHEGDVNAAEAYMNTYFTLCDQYQFRTMELNLLQYVNRQPVMKNSDSAGTYTVMEKEILRRNLSEITTEYAQILLADMSNTKENLQQNEKMNSQKHEYILAGVVIISILLVLLMFAYILWDYMSRDGLTKLNNRKKYESLRTECEKKQVSYGFLMVDIDDFKKVNDTLGHAQGDAVLAGIASILLRYTGRGIHAFRYGGEEMCMMFLNVPEQRVREIAQEIRGTIENSRFVEDRKVTISGGLCMSEKGENVFVCADKKLYEAKAAGKNRIY